jgi:hypothetical protein
MTYICGLIAIVKVEAWLLELKSSVRVRCGDDCREIPGDRNVAARDVGEEGMSGRTFVVGEGKVSATRGRGQVACAWLALPGVHASKSI